MKRAYRPYMPGSIAHEYLKKIARLLDGKVATEFYGIEVNGQKILYRHGLAWTQRGKKNAYDQIAWHKPFGSSTDHRATDFVLLHATKPKALFFLFPTKKAQALAMAYPRKLNIAADPHNVSETRQRIFDAKLSLEELRRKLRA